MIYRIWDTDSANLVADCTTIDAARDAIRRAISFSGVAAITTWALECEDDQGTVTVLAEGADLASAASEGIPA